MLARMLPVPDTWVGCADAYLAALDRVARGATAMRRPVGASREERTQSLATWHLLLLDSLAAGSRPPDRRRPKDRGRPDGLKQSPSGPRGSAS